MRITQLSDMAFGFVGGPADQRMREDICVYANTNNDAYSVIATGSGAGGAFELDSGLDSLPFEVQWADSANQSSGTTLNAGVTSPAFVSGAGQQTCNNAPTATASLIVVLRAAQLDRVTAGSYSGLLQITIVPN